MDAHTADVVRLAWSRGLGLGDDAALAAGRPRAIVATDDDGPVEFVQVFGAEALRGPAALIGPVAALGAPAFADGTALAALREAAPAGGAGRAMRIRAREALGYRDHYSPRAAGPLPTVSHAPHDAARVLDACPADDAAAVAGDLTGGPGGDPDGPPPFTLLDGDGPVALAGYRTVHHLLADVRVITAAHARRRGHARTVGALAADDALDAGLICQARIPAGSAGAGALARALGFAASGHRVVFDSGPAYHR